MSLFAINQDMTLKDALIQIEKNKHRSLVVVNDKNQVVGTLSDGDIRKAFINDIVSDVAISKIMNRDFLYLTHTLDTKEKKQFFENNNIFIVPIVKNDFTLLDILTKE